MEIYQANWGAPGEYHYVLVYDSWESLEASYAKLNAPGSDFMKLNQRRANDESVAEQTAFFTGSTLN